MKERRSFGTYHVSRDVAAVARPVYANRVGPLCPSSPSPPLFLVTKRSRSNFHPVRNFYFSSNETTKGGQSLASSARGGMGQGSERHSPFSGRSTTGSGTVSFLRQSIQLPRNRHRRRWEDGNQQEGRNLSLFSSLSFPSLNFSTSSLSSWIPFVSLPATRARNNERGRGKKGEEKKEREKQGEWGKRKNRFSKIIAGSG